MKKLLLTAILSAAIAWTAAAVTRPATPVRLVSASLAVDGEVVLRASTSDDGSPDADAVWRYLKGALVFRPTEAFGQLEVDTTGDEVTLGWLKSRANADQGEPPDLVLDVRYGGLDRPHVLRLVRTGAAGDAWRIAAEEVEARFPYRRITRREAAELERQRLK